jgi:peptide/nickel transport system ATP-binding protein
MNTLVLNQVSAGYDHTPIITGFDLTITAGSTVGLVGDSGAGKSTIAKVAALLRPPMAGSVILNGIATTCTGYRVAPATRRKVALVFQSPRRATDPRWTLHGIITAPALLGAARTERSRRVDGALGWAEMCGLTEDLLARHPSEVSDGQLQRACLARALATGPQFLICDEMTAMTDAITTAALVNVVRTLAADQGLGVLAISHDHRLLDVWADHHVVLD